MHIKYHKIWTIFTQAIYFIIYFFLLCLIIPPAATVMLLFIFMRFNLLLTIWVVLSCKLFVFLCKYILHINYIVKGSNNIPEQGPFIIASRHESLWETFFLLQYVYSLGYGLPIFILKKELLDIPIYGAILRAIKMGSIDRSNGRSAIYAMKLAVQDAIDQSKVIIIFPEGTRVNSGQKSRCKKGIGYIAVEYKDIPIVPLYLDSGMVWSKRHTIPMPGCVSVEFKKAIPRRMESDSVDEVVAEIEREINHKDDV